MFRSLRFRLLVPTLAVALLAVVATAIVTNVSATDDARSELRDQIENEREIVEVLDTFALLNGSWDAVGGVVEALAGRYQARITLTRFDGNVVIDSVDLGSGPDIEHGSQELAVIDPSNVDQSIFDESAVESLGAIEELEALIIDCMTSLGVPFELVEDEVTDARTAIPDGSPESFDAYEICLEEQDDFVDQGLFELEVNGIPVPIESAQFFSAEPVLLFVAFESSTTEIGGAFDGRLLVALVGVLAIAIVTVTLVASRLLRPIRNLTVAAEQMSAGALSSRVDAPGNDELGALGSAFNSMAASLQDEDRRRRRLTSDIAHELRSPLSNIRGYLEAAKDGVTELDESLVETVLGDALLLQKLIDDLQVVSLADAGALRLDAEPRRLAAAVEAVVESNRQVATDGGVDVVIDVDAAHMALLDDTRFRQILQNLMTNAVRHTDSGGAVVIASTVGADFVTVEVRDTGTGISAEHLPHVFERFYRADSSRTRGTGGTGLGLAITQSLVEAHGGAITVASVEGVGSTFSFTLPVAPPR